jgi:hypothetical protein
MFSKWTIMRTKAIFLLLFVLLTTYNGQAQTAVLAGSIDEFSLRDQQLLGKLKNSYSFTVRPVLVHPLDSAVYFSDPLLQQQQRNYFNKKKSIRFIAIPLGIQQQYNTHSAWGRNNEDFLLTAGYQQMIKVGAAIHSKWLNVQLIPAYFWAAPNSILSKGYQKFSLGQSAIRLKLGPSPLSISLSTENLWWGPGVFNSLMMSNNAPSFPHVSFHTNKPIKTPVGHFEFQVIGGQLSSKANLPFENKDPNTLYPSFSLEKRYFNGINFAYQPIFAKGFTVGMNRMFQRYEKDADMEGSFLQKYMPVVTSVFKSNTGGGNGVVEDARSRDQLVNLFARYLFQQYNTEIYGEFGWNDHKYNIRDLTLNPDHAAAYLVGLRKVFAIDSKKRFTLEAEATQLEPTNSEIARNAGNWYVHGIVLEGYTNENQIIGGGIGPGDNTATIRMTYSTKSIRQSLRIERYQHDPRFHDNKWTDWSFAIAHQQMIKKYLVGAAIDFVSRSGFQWTKQNFVNMQFNLKVQYFLF